MGARIPLVAKVAVPLVLGPLMGAGAYMVASAEPTASVAAPTVPVTAPPVETTTATSTSTTTSATLPPILPVVIDSVGDTNFDPRYIPALAANGYDYAFAGVGDLFTEDDLSIVNLECSPSDLGVAIDKDYIFQCDPAALPVAFAHGIDVANLANNHSQDYGKEALADGIANVRAAGIAPVGVGANLAEATTPALFEIGGRTVAVLGFGGVFPADSWAAAADRAGMASGDDTEMMVEAVRAAKQIADIVVVEIHWGVELRTEPDAGDRDRATRMIEAGADVIFGHHPHRLGRLEFIDGKPVYWTLGNFVWPRLSDQGATTAVARVVFQPDGQIVACLVPAFIERPGQPVLQADPHCEGE